MNGLITGEHVFGGPPASPYFGVLSGVPKIDAIRHAICTINSVHQRLSKGIGDGEIDICEAWLMSEALEAAEALLQACE